MRATIPVLVVAVLLLAACGGGSASGNGEATKPAATVVKDAQAAVKSASSIHAVLVSRPRNLRVDAVIVPSRGGTLSFTAGAVRYDVVDLDGIAYIHGNTAYLNSAAAKVLHGRWLGCPTNSYMGRVGAPSLLLLAFFNGMNHGTLENKGETTYNGERAVEITASSGATLYVAATGKPYPIALVSPGAPTTIFDKYNAPVTLTKPTNVVGPSPLCNSPIYGQTAP